MWTRVEKKSMLGREAAWVKTGSWDRVCLLQSIGETVGIISSHKS